MVKHFFIFSIVFFFQFSNLIAEQFFRIEIEPTIIPNAPAVHSAAIVSYEGKWIIIGGKTNGLHGFNAIDPFTLSNSNQNIYIVNPTTSVVSSLSVNNLPILLREALTVSNMQFYLDDSILYFSGGYGWNDSAQEFLTSRALVAIDVKQLITVIENQQANNLSSCFRMIKDERLAVTGAHIRKLSGMYYLVFGHLFDGTYSRNVSLAVQRYTRAIRKFSIDDDGINLNINNYSEVYDSLNFRRRDYNLAYQIFPDKSLGLTAFTGVFQEGIDEPYLNTINIAENNYLVNNNFSQNLSQYHSAIMPVYDSINNTMHTLFFGGMAMYYNDSATNTLVYDNKTPFVKTISRVSRDSIGNMIETEMDQKFPALLGTNAEFIVANDRFDYTNGILHLNKISNKRLVGYIYGGIESPEPNISDIDPGLSFASTRIYKVYINKNPLDTTITKNTFKKVIEPLSVNISPNPFKNSFTLSFVNEKETFVHINLIDANGVYLKNMYEGSIKTKNIPFNTKNLASGIYYVEVKNNSYRKVFRVVKE